MNSSQHTHHRLLIVSTAFKTKRYLYAKCVISAVIDPHAYAQNVLKVLENVVELFSYTQLPSFTD